MTKDSPEKIALDLIKKASASTVNEQYGIIFDALESVINGEDDKQMLALMATQLFQLSEVALKKSGYPLLGECDNCTIN